MSGSEVRLERKGGAALITVDRPEAHNAMTSAMSDRLLAVLEELHEDRELRVVVLRGAGGKAFIAGADIKEFASASADTIVKGGRREQKLLRLIETLPAPTIAVVEGYAMGGGIGLAIVCDFRICTSDAKFGVMSARSLGNCLHPMGFSRLGTLLGQARAKEMLILARVLDAEIALSWGLVNEVVARDDLEARISALTEQICSQAPLSMWAAKQALLRDLPEPSDDFDIVKTVHDSDDFREGVAAFVEKRSPTWSDSPPRWEPPQ